MEVNHTLTSTYAPGRSTEERVPSIGAALAATLAGWVIDELFEPYLGVASTLVISFAVSTVVFFVVQRRLKALRDG